MGTVGTSGKISPPVGGVPADQQVVAKSSIDETKALQKSIGSYQKRELVALVSLVASQTFAFAAVFSGAATGVIAYATFVVIVSGVVVPSVIAFSPLLIGTASLTAATAFCLFFAFTYDRLDQSNTEMFREMRFPRVFNKESMIEDFKAGESRMKNRLVNFPLEMKGDLLNFKESYDRLVLSKKEPVEKLRKQKIELLNKIKEEKFRLETDCQLLHSILGKVTIHSKQEGGDAISAFRYHFNQIEAGRSEVALQIEDLPPDVQKMEVESYTIPDLVLGINGAFASIRTCESEIESIDKQISVAMKSQEPASAEIDGLYRIFIEEFSTKAYEIYQNAVLNKPQGKVPEVMLEKKSFLGQLRSRMERASDAKELTILETIIKNPYTKLKP